MKGAGKCIFLMSLILSAKPISNKALHRDAVNRARALDNVFVERLWRSVKYEHVYLYEYETVPELEKGLSQYFAFYNHGRPHQSLSYRTPAEVHFAGLSCPIVA